MRTSKKASSRFPRHAGPAKRSSSARDPFQQILLKMLSAATHGGELTALLSIFCREARKFLKISGVGYWELEADSLKPLEADGYFAHAFKKSPLLLKDSVAAHT